MQLTSETGEYFEDQSITLRLDQTAITVDEQALGRTFKLEDN